MEFLFIIFFVIYVLLGALLSLMSAEIDTIEELSYLITEPADIMGIIFLCLLMPILVIGIPEVFPEIWGKRFEWEKCSRIEKGTIYNDRLNNTLIFLVIPCLLMGLIFPWIKVTVYEALILLFYLLSALYLLVHSQLRFKQVFGIIAIIIMVLPSMNAQSDTITIAGDTIDVPITSVPNSAYTIAQIYIEMGEHGGARLCDRGNVPRNHIKLRPNKACEWSDWAVCSWASVVDPSTINLHICSCDTRMEWDWVLNKYVRKILIGRLTDELPPLTGLHQVWWQVHEKGDLSVTYRDATGLLSTYFWRFSPESGKLRPIPSLNWRP